MEPAAAALQLGGLDARGQRDGPDAVRRQLEGHRAAEEPEMELLGLAELPTALMHQIERRLDDAEGDALGLGALARHRLPEREGGVAVKPSRWGTTAAQSVGTGARLILVVSAMALAATPAGLRPSLAIVQSAI